MHKINRHPVTDTTTNESIMKIILQIVYGKFSCNIFAVMTKEMVCPIVSAISLKVREGNAVLYCEEREKRQTWNRRTVHLLIRSSLSSLSISSSIAACRSPILLKASLRSACKLWFAASKLSMSISYQNNIIWRLTRVQIRTSMMNTVHIDTTVLGLRLRHAVYRNLNKSGHLTSSCFFLLASVSFLASSPISSLKSRSWRCRRLFCSFSRFSLVLRWSRSSVSFSTFSFSLDTRL